MRLRPHSFWPIVLATPLGLLAAWLACAAIAVPWADQAMVEKYPVLAAPFLMAGVPGTLHTLAVVAEVCAGLLLLGSVAALLVRRQWALWALHKSYILVYILFAFFLHCVVRISSVIMEGNIKLDGVAPTAQSQFFLRWHFLWPAIIVVLVIAFLHLLSWRRSVFTIYTGVHDETPATGDRVIENLLSDGRDPRFRQSMLGSVLSHVLIIFVLPWLLSLLSHVTPYNIFKGSGTPNPGHEGKAPIRVQVVQKPKKKVTRKLIVNPNAAISFYVPNLDDSTVSKDIDKGSDLTYVANTARVASNSKATSGTGRGRGAGSGSGTGSGNLGRGSNKGPGGWPDGTEGGVVRFIRLEYNGNHWDDGMDFASGADLNFLKKLHEETGFPIAANSEKNSVRNLKQYPKGKAPPFIFMTGDEGIEMPPGDMVILRDYLTNGGMLFADCGGPQWNQSFRRFMNQLFPDSPMREIADDDQLFQEPYEFPNGAPPLWHHGGSRAMGVKYHDRWVVFYHPGDVNDAWKNGHSGMSEELAEAAYEIGINVVYYSFTEYLKATAQYRK